MKKFTTFNVFDLFKFNVVSQNSHKPLSCLLTTINCHKERNSTPGPKTVVCTYGWLG